MKSYQPSQKVLEKYADVLVNFALGKGKGVKKGEVVRIFAEESAKPLYFELVKAVIKAGGHVLPVYTPSDEAPYNFSKNFYQNANDDQIKFFPKKYLKAQADLVDHSIAIISEEDKHALDGVNPKKIMERGKIMRQYRNWLTEKENRGKFSWTIALYGTEPMAREANMSLKQYWNQIIKACFLDEKNPIATWKAVYKDMEKYRTKLNKLTQKTDKWHVHGPDVDLWISAGEKRAWKSGSGANIPSFELFTSPDWRGTEGWIKINQPLYRYGNLIEGIELWFEKGRVVKSKATKNQKVLREMIATPDADKIGEFSMTDKRHSRITKFMGETLYDENVGGPNGNTHIALGMAYKDCYDGDPSKVTKAQWKKLGYNDSSVHTDVISTAPRTVTAHLKDGTTQVIYKNGMFQL